MFPSNQKKTYLGKKKLKTSNTLIYINKYMRFKYLLITLSVILSVGIVLSAFQVSLAATPNPGHLWDQMICDTNMCVSTTTGRVGIGTAVPTSELHVYKNVSGTNAEIAIQSGNGSTVQNKWGIYQNQADGGLNFWNLNNLVTFAVAGNVGIGMTPSSYKLDVSGDINTSGVYRKGGTAGAVLTCSGNTYLQNSVISGGIITGGNCASGPVGLTGAQGIQGIQGIQGATGANGPANVLSVGTVTTGAAGTAASASITGTTPAQVLNLTIPKGDRGTDGTNGTPGTPGSKGDKGDPGATGAPGPSGLSGISLINGLENSCSYNTCYASAPCGLNQKVLGGGCRCKGTGTSGASTEVYLRESYPDHNYSWYCLCVNDDGTQQTSYAQAYVICGIY
jgi:hypothetical protein